MTVEQPSRVGPWRWQSIAAAVAGCAVAGIAWWGEGARAGTLFWMAVPPIPARPWLLVFGALPIGLVCGFRPIAVYLGYWVGSVLASVVASPDYPFPYPLLHGITSLVAFPGLLVGGAFNWLANAARSYGRVPE